MKKNIFIFLLLLIPLATFSQIDGEDEVYLNADRIDPKFRGDDKLDEFSEYINSEFDFSKVTKPGKMIFAFTIDEEGKVKNIKVVQVLDMESSLEIIRVMKKCPNWEPAKRNGKPISVELKYPMNFKMKTK
ncbi:energy transducer TonB [Flavobacterium sp.]|mgnify:CR=1 FL=1|uniref:energy transducer TonB n=1 Tax=Flavobacterium sp. TaxID=239 RepID=UPI0035B47B6C